MDEDQLAVGRVLGTDDATPLSFWVALGADQYLQLDDVRRVGAPVAGAAVNVRIYGLVTQVRARHEGARFDSDVFLIEDGVLPAEVSQAAQVLATRFEPEVFVPPLPRSARLQGCGRRTRRSAVLRWHDQTVAGLALTRDDEPLFANLEFLDGTRGAHVNISGISGVADEDDLRHVPALQPVSFRCSSEGEAINTKALIYNVKGEDLLFLDRANTELTEDDRGRYDRLGLAPRRFRQRRVLGSAPARRSDCGA